MCFSTCHVMMVFFYLGVHLKKKKKEHSLEYVLYGLRKLEPKFYPNLEKIADRDRYGV